MTRERLIEILEKNKFSYREEEEKLIITSGNLRNEIRLNFESEIPSNIEFRNPGNVEINHIKELPEGIIFSNFGDVSMNSLEKISNGAEFNNKGMVKLPSIRSISRNVKFGYLNTIIDLGLIYIDEWEGNIEDIDPTDLLNNMISNGLFEK